MIHFSGKNGGHEIIIHVRLVSRLVSWLVGLFYDMSIKERFSQCYLILNFKIFLFFIFTFFTCEERLIVSLGELVCPFGDLWTVTYQLQISILIFFCLCSLNIRDVVLWGLKNDLVFFLRTERRKIPFKWQLYFGVTYDCSVAKKCLSWPLGNSHIPKQGVEVY